MTMFSFLKEHVAREASPNGAPLPARERLEVFASFTEQSGLDSQIAALDPKFVRGHVDFFQSRAGGRRADVAPPADEAHGPGVIVDAVAVEARDGSFLAD